MRCAQAAHRGRPCSVRRLTRARRSQTLHASCRDGSAARHVLHNGPSATTAATTRSSPQRAQARVRSAAAQLEHTRPSGRRSRSGRCLSHRAHTGTVTGCPAVRRWRKSRYREGGTSGSPDTKAFGWSRRWSSSRCRPTWRWALAEASACSASCALRSGSPAHRYATTRARTKLGRCGRLMMSRAGGWCCAAPAVAPAAILPRSCEPGRSQLVRR